MNKICIYFESYLVGGLDTFTYQLINNWNSEDELVLMCNKSHSGAKYFEEKITNPNCQVEIYDMPMVSDWESNLKNRHVARMIHILSFLIHVPYYIIWGYKRLRLNRFTHLYVINGGYPACVSSRCVAISWWLYTKKKSLHNFHNLAVTSAFPNSIVDNWIDKMLIKATSYFVSVSKASAESIRIRKPFRKLSNITFIYNGTSDKTVKPSFNLRKKLALSNDTTLLMMLATYEERKGHKMIVDVLANLLSMKSKSHLVFLGYGEDSEIKTVEAYAHAKGVENHVTCLGFQPNAMEYLAQTDFLLIGSQGFESFGLTSIEAMKYKKIVISTNVGGLKEVIKNGEGGFLFEPNDSKGMAEKIFEISNSPASYNDIANKGYLRYLNMFTASRVSKEYRDLLMKTI